ncbi:MAG: PLP-dependent transferase [Clostridia bacterium]|nr:PLP-dependent transferase [Clostridia bacterium]
MKIETLCLHADQNLKDEWGSITEPVYLSATFVHSSTSISTYSYSRLSNPTRKHLENTVAAIEYGSEAFAFSSGMAALSTVMKLFSVGSHIIASNDLYGGSLRLFRNVNAQLEGLSFDFVDTFNTDNIEKLINANTKAIYLETPSNPLLLVTDIAEVASIAKKNNLLLIVDNTFLSPYLQNPLSHGADIVIHSGTKYLSGHNDVLAGFAVVKDPSIAEKIAYYSKTIGACLSPFDSFLVERGIKTLPIRMDRICENAKKIAYWLRDQPFVTKVNYIGFSDRKDYPITLRQSRGFGGMISFELSSARLARKLLEGVRLFQYAESLGGVDSLVTYPMAQTHADLPEKERELRGINDRFLRISVGLENVEDLIEDLRQAIENEI